MILQMFTVFDSKAGAYLPPFYNNSNGSAMRNFSDTVNEPGSLLYKHPEDFTLFHIGSFNDADGICTLVTHSSLGKAIDFKFGPEFSEGPIQAYENSAARAADSTP